MSLLKWEILPIQRLNVCMFFTNHFAAITVQNNLLPPAWPGESIVRKLTAHAAGLFTWADTITKFIERGIPNM
jgi:hypothetical protein